MARAGLSHSAVLDSAVTFVNTEGFETLTLGKLARRLNVKPPSLYNHVDGLEGLRRDLMLRSYQLLGQDLQKAAVGKSGKAALLSIARAYRRFALAQPGLFTATLKTVEDEDETLKVAGYEVLETILTVLKGFDLSGDNALHATRALRAALTGFVVLELQGGFGMPVDIDESFDRLLLLFVRQLSN